MSLSRALAFLFCLLPAVNVTWADEADDLASAITAHVHGRLPASAPPMTAEDASRVTAFTHYIFREFYYPTNPRELQAAAFAAIDSAETPASATSLEQAAMIAVVNSLGHGARVLTTLGSDAPEGGATAPIRLEGSIEVVTLPTMNVTDPNTPRTCADFVRYFDFRASDGVTGVVLDLRGNEGGPLTDSACLAGFFLKNGEPLFEVVGKQGKVVKYRAESKGHNVIGVPAAVLIDTHTDTGGLLVAAVLQDHRRAAVIGALKTGINGAVSSLVFPPAINRAVVLPTGEILLPDKRPLEAGGVHVDIPAPTQDDNALLNAARNYLALR